MDYSYKSDYLNPTINKTQNNSGFFSLKHFRVKTAIEIEIFLIREIRKKEKKKQIYR